VHTSVCGYVCTLLCVGIRLISLTLEVTVSTVRIVHTSVCGYVCTFLCVGIRLISLTLEAIVRSAP